MSIYKILLGLFLLFAHNIVAQNSIKLLTEKKGVSLRGLSVPNDQVIWASGSKGTIAKSVDGGKSFEWIQVKNYALRDFRAIHAWNSNEAIVVAVAAPAIILKTKDGGVSWDKVYENTDTAMFLDAIHFKDTENGFVVGDPINGNIFLLSTRDKGDSWQQVPSSFFKSNLNKGEAFFASSNSNIAMNNKDLFFVSGGISSRLWINGLAMDLPITQGRNSTGANSIAISPNGNQITIVGGDFAKDKYTDSAIVKLELHVQPNTDNKHLSLRNPIWRLDKNVANPNGYRSSVIYLDNKTLIVCGTSGVDISNNRGQNWQLVSKESFHVVHIQPNTKNAIFAGAGGRIGMLSLD